MVFLKQEKGFILIGSLNHNPDEVFEKLRKNKDSFLKLNSLNEHVTIEEAIGDLLYTNPNRPCPDYPTYNSSIYGKITSPYQAFMRKDIGKDENIANCVRI